MLSRLFAPALEVHAHCDLPCGVYDPAQARIEAESVKAIIGNVTQQLNIDRGRIFATGMSNGGMLAYRLACEMADTFKAVASVESAGSGFVQIGPKRQPKILFEEGESVRVVSGPFANFSGFVDQVHPDKEKVRVMVQVFGRATVWANGTLLGGSDPRKDGCALGY